MRGNLAPVNYLAVKQRMDPPNSSANRHAREAENQRARATRAVETRGSNPRTNGASNAGTNEMVCALTVLQPNFPDRRALENVF